MKKELQNKRCEIIALLDMKEKTLEKLNWIEKDLKTAKLKLAELEMEAAG